MKLLLTPKFLTREIAEEAVGIALQTAITSSIKDRVKGMDCHVVVIVPSMEDDRSENYPKWPNYPIIPFPLYQRSVGQKKDWPRPYDEIAMCKGLQLWTKRNDGRTSPIPHLLFPGDTPFWGGVDRNGFIVACSGFRSWFDTMVSGISSDIMVALAHEAYVKDPDACANFLS